MANFYNFSILFIILTIQLLQGALSVEYHVSNEVPGTPGGIRFEKEIGVDYTLQQMKDATQVIYQMFDQIDNPGDRRPQNNGVYLFISNYEGLGETGGNYINVSATAIKDYQGDDIKWDFSCLYYHEMTHVFQWLPNDAPDGLLEGIAHYTLLTSNHWQAGQAEPGQGDRWDEGYAVTARFLEYCNSLLDGFVAKLNKKMKNDTYSDSYFVELLGKPVDELWQDYKKKYSNVTHTYVTHHRKLLY